VLNIQSIEVARLEFTPPDEEFVEDSPKGEVVLVELAPFQLGALQFDDLKMPVRFLELVQRVQEA
jgi:hypothetical protein